MKNPRSPTDPRSPTIVCNVGLDESSHGKSGTLYDVQNMRVDVANGTLRKRPGHGAVSPVKLARGFSSKPTPGARAAFFASMGDQNLVGHDNGNVFSVESGYYEPQGIVSTVEPLGYRTSCFLELAGSGAFSASMPPSVAVNSMGIALACCSRGRGWLVVFDRTGGQVLHRTFAALRVVVFTLNSTFYAAVQVTATSVKIYKIESPYTEMLYVKLVFTVVAGSVWDVLSRPDSSEWWIVRQFSATIVRIGRFLLDNASGSQDITVASGTWLASLSLLGSQLWVGLLSQSSTPIAVSYAVYVSDALTEILAPTELFSSAALLSWSTAGVGDGLGSTPPTFSPVYDNEQYGTAAANEAFYCFAACMPAKPGSAVADLVATIVGTAGTDGAHDMAYPVWGCVPVSRPDDRNRVWVSTWVCNDSSLHRNRYALLRFRASESSIIRPTIELTTEEWLGASVKPSWFSGVAYDADSSFFSVLRTLSTSVYNPSVMAVVVEYKTAEQGGRVSPLVVDRALMVSGQPVDCATRVEGSAEPSSSEVGWISPPAVLNHWVSGLVGTLLAGTYRWVGVWEFVDQQGRLHLSQPSADYEVTVPSGGTVWLDWTTCPVSHRIGTGISPYLRVYRSLGEGDVESTTHNLQNIFTGVNLSSGILRTFDNRPDSRISAEEFLYTDGGPLANAMAPACRYLVKSADRVWCGGLLKTELLQASALLIPDEPVLFKDHDAFRVALPEANTGLAYQDGALVAFTEHGIYLVTGAGPDDRGVGQFDAPQQYSAIGCPLANAHTILTTETGIVFMSASGLKLIPRGFGVLQSIGDAICETVASLICRDAAVADAPLGQEVRYLFGSDSSYVGGQNPTLIPASNRVIMSYDLAAGRWYRDVLSHDAGRLGVWGGGFVHSAPTLMASGAHFYYQNNVNAKEDTSGQIMPALVRTSWQHPFGVGGFGRVNRLLVASEGQPVRLQLTVETDTGASQTAILEYTSTRSPYNYREMALAFPPCGSYRVTVTELQFSGYANNREFGLVAIVADVDDSDTLRPADEGERV